MSLITDYGIQPIQAGQSQEYLSANEAMQRLLDLIANPTDVAVTSGNVALTAAQARYGLINATSVGDPGANREISVPSGLEGIWVVRNAIGSSRELTFKVDGGTGVTIPDGESRLCYSRGGSAAESISVTVSGYATETYVDDAIAALVDSSPAALNTLNELAAALGDDENFAATVTTALADKVDTSDPRLTDERDPTDHGHTGTGDGGSLDTPVFDVQGSNPSTPAAGKMKVFAKEDGSGDPRLYAINEDGTVYDLTHYISSWLGLNDVPNSYTGYGGGRPFISRAEDGITFTDDEPIQLTDGATIATDCSALPAQGAKFYVTLGGNRAFSTPSSVLQGMALTYYLTQDGTGTRNPTWWAGIKWRGGSAPNLAAAAANSIAVVTLHYINSVWIGNYSEAYS